MSAASALRRAVLAARDAVADGLASAAAASPAVERGLVGAGRALHRLRPVDVVYRRAITTLADEMTRRSDPYREVRIGPVTLMGDVTHFTLRWAYFKGDVYEPRTTGFVLSALEEGGTFVDIGANHGYFTLLAAARVGTSGRVAAFEPNPVVAAELRAQLALNPSAAAVRVEQAALADAEGQETLYVSVCPGNDGLSSLVLSDEARERGLLAESSAVAVRTTTYDAWAAQAGFGRADLVKIDVEGAEERVLRGMARTLADAPPRRIVLETVTGSAAYRLLESSGYRAEPLEMLSGEHGNHLFTRR